MAKPLRILFVEDVEQDVMLVVRALEHGGFDVSYKRVETPDAMSMALRNQPWDVVISDYSLPGFSAPMALALVKERDLDLPFIIVSGTVNEDVAIASMHAGAHDFMAKGNIARLIPAIERELRAVATRSEQRKMQDQLMISDRMASMGTLAAGVAHEINNPLACVMANLDLIATNIHVQAEALGLQTAFREVREELNDARVAAERIRKIVRDLKVFSRNDEEKKKPIHIQPILESTLRMAWNEIRHRARVVKNYSKTAPVHATESGLGQVFLNLMVNAAQAMVEGQAEQNEIRICTATDASGYVIVTIADTGSGMSPEVLGRLFTPFFTTKAVGVGTGLGLSICHRLVVGFGGSIQVKSQAGEGTTFEIAFPPAASQATEETAPIVCDLPAPRRGKVLVVDDEKMICTAVQRTLGATHDVVTTQSAEEALRRIRSGEQFDVILCDLMMPQMTGMDLHGALSGIGTAQAAAMIFLTGGAFTPRARAFLDGTANQRVEKPFDPAHLRALINDRIRRADDAA